MSLRLASSGYVDADPDVLPLAAAGTLVAVPGCRYGNFQRVGDLEVASWGRIHSVFGELGYFVLSRLKRGWFGWRRSFGNVFGTAFAPEVEEAFCCMLGRLVTGLSRFVKSSL
jgi:hypothetical protein